MPYDIIIGRNESDKKKLGNRGLIYLGRGYVKMGQYTSLSNKIYMDVARSHVVLVAGKRGSGKSYTLGVVAEELSNLEKSVAKNIASLIFDTMGIYWTMKHENYKDKLLLQEWNLNSKNLPVNLFVPYGHYDNYIEKGIPADNKFALDVMEMNTEDWILTFNLNIVDPIAILIERAISKLQNSNKKFDIEDIIEELKKEKDSDKDTLYAAISLFEAALTWGIFAKKGTKPTQISDLITGGKTTVLDLSVYNAVGTFNVRSLVISLVSRKIFNQRMSSRKKEEVESIASGVEYGSSLTPTSSDNPLVWILIDEAHEFLPLEGKTLATDALVQLLREGRQPGISLVLATQQPGQIHRDVMTQSDIVISHRVTSHPDITALNYIMQTYLLESINKYMNELPDSKGSALLLDDNSERIYSIKIRPRFTWHGGEAPTAVNEL